MRQTMSFLVCLILMAGCSETLGPNRIPPGSTITFSLPPDEVFRSAARVVEETYRIDSVDRDRGIIRAVPMEYTSKESIASMSDVLVQSNHTFRRVLTLQVRSISDNQVSVSARADLQRLDTTPIAAFANQRQGDDRPAEQRNAGVITDRERAEVWTSIRRDYAAEQEILDKIRQLVKENSL